MTQGGGGGKCPSPPCPLKYSPDIHNMPVGVALKFTVHGVQSFIKGHRKSGVISIKHSRDNYD